MKHVFIINPVAGKGQIQKELVRTITSVCNGMEDPWEIYETTYVGDAMFYVEKYPGNDLVRFYAIGGDGTLNEVANGAVLRGNAEVGVFPCGSGNDFIRVFSQPEDFMDVKKQVNGKSKPIDLIKANGNYAVNMCNMGVDAQTAADVHRYTKFIPGALAYSVSLANRLVHKLGYEARIVIDDREIVQGNLLLGTFANGIAYGGGYICAPKARLDDGFMDLCLIRPVSRILIAKLLQSYKAGKHLDSPEFKKYMIYRRCTKVIVETPLPQKLCIDGEILTATQSTMELIPKILPFVYPKGVM